MGDSEKLMLRLLAVTANPFSPWRSFLWSYQTCPTQWGSVFIKP